MEKALGVIEEMARLGVIKAYAIGDGIAATYYIEPILTYDLRIVRQHGLGDRLKKLEESSHEE